MPHPQLDIAFSYMPPLNERCTQLEECDLHLSTIRKNLVKPGNLHQADNNY